MLLTREGLCRPWRGNPNRLGIRRVCICETVGFPALLSADTRAVGSILIPAMEKGGCDVDFAPTLTATSSTIGPVIPPSIPLIVYGVRGEVSIASLFVADMISSCAPKVFDGSKKNQPPGYCP